MNTNILIEIFSRDLNRLKTEIQSYHNEAAIWGVEKQIKNSGGNLCLHLIGNLNTYIGAGLGNTAYIRDREQEFQLKNVPRTELIRMIDETIAVVQATLGKLAPGKLDETYPMMVLEKETSTGFLLVHLAAHLSYHLGQVNYHRRLIDAIDL